MIFIFFLTRSFPGATLLSYCKRALTSNAFPVFCSVSPLCADKSTKLGLGPWSELALYRRLIWPTIIEKPFSSMLTILYLSHETVNVSW
jgi:hypothetical protein